MNPNDRSEMSLNSKTQSSHFLGRVIGRIETGLNIAGTAFIMILMVMTAGEIIGRYLFNTPIPGYVEDAELIMAGIVFLGMAYTQRKGAHIGMDIIVDKIKGRPHHVIKAMTHVLAVIGIGIICIYSFNLTIDAYQTNDVTPYLQTPTWPSKLCIPIGTFFLGLRFFIQMVEEIGRAMGFSKV